MKRRILMPLAGVLLIGSSSLFAMEAMKKGANFVIKAVPGVISAVGKADSLQNSFKGAVPKVKAESVALNVKGEKNAEKMKHVGTLITEGVAPLSELVSFLKDINDNILKYAADVANKPELSTKLADAVKQAEDILNSMKEAGKTTVDLAEMVAMMDAAKEAEAATAAAAEPTPSPAKKTGKGSPVPAATSELETEEGEVVVPAPRTRGGTVTKKK